MKLTELLNEELEVTAADSLDTMKSEMSELQAELKIAKKKGNKDIINQIEQDIHELSQLIKNKR